MLVHGDRISSFSQTSTNARPTPAKWDVQTYLGLTNATAETVLFSIKKSRSASVSEETL